MFGKGKWRRRPRLRTEKKENKKSFWRRPIEETVKKYVDLMRGEYDDLLIPIGRFYRDCRWESDGWDDGEEVIMKLQEVGYEVRFVRRQGIWDRIYVKISR